MKLTPVGKLIALILVIGIVAGGWRLFGDRLVPKKEDAPSVAVEKVELPPTPVTAPGSNGPVTIPGSAPGVPDKPEVRMLVWAWNAQMGLMFANGGQQASQGSLMAKHDINLKLERQDDSGKMQEALVAFATDLSRGERNPTKGAHFVGIMGDGAATFLRGVNETLKRLGPEFQAKVVGSCGYSRGEDKFMGPNDWKINPAASKGGVVAGVLRDGDWNIAQKWLGDNGLRNNPDEKTWDPDALNWVGASDYIDAAQKYISGFNEDRPVVKNGKRTGETKHIVVNAVVTWTPGDVQVAQKKGGLVSIVSTKEYASQMPHVIIGIDKWMKDNRTTTEGFLQAVMEGGDAVKSSPDALSEASKVSQVVYNEKDAGPAYWEKYYKGTQEKDAQGYLVDLGGSSVNNLADNMYLFGLYQGSSNLFAATYKVFGDIVVVQYHTLMPNYPPVDQILDTSYVKDIVDKVAPGSREVKIPAPTYPTPGSKPASVVSKRAWNIHFATGRATFVGNAQDDLNKMKRDLLIASGTTVEIHGHTDNVGDMNANMKLSEDRAFAVKNWLMKVAPANFPTARIAVMAHGQTNPVASNSSESGRAQNRRVEVVLKSAGQ